MAVTLNLTDIQSGFSSAAAFNANNTLIEEALAKTLNRTSNASDNAMEVDLDMGLNNIFNVNLINGEDVSSLSGNLTKVADLSDEVNTVADNIGSVNTVATDIANVNSVGSNIVDVTTIADNLANVNIVADNIADVNTVATSISDVNSVADNIADVVSFSDLYLGSKTSDPATDNDGDPLLDGALYFNTDANGGNGELRIYNLTGGTWDVAAFSATAANGVTYNNGTSGLTATDVQAAIDEVDANVDALGTASTRDIGLATADVPEITYQEVTINGDFNGFTLKLMKIGRIVTAWSDGAVSHSSGSTVVGVSGEIPSAFRPSDIYNQSILFGSFLETQTISSAGQFRMGYKLITDGSNATRTGTTWAINMTYAAGS